MKCLFDFVKVIDIIKPLPSHHLLKEIGFLVQAFPKYYMASGSLCVMSGFLPPGDGGVTF